MPVDSMLFVLISSQTNLLVCVSNFRIVGGIRIRPSPGDPTGQTIGVPAGLLGRHDLRTRLLDYAP